VTGETSTVYAVLLDWPSNSSVLLGALSSHHVSSVEMLGLIGMMVLYIIDYCIVVIPWLLPFKMLSFKNCPTYISI